MDHDHRSDAPAALARNHQDDHERQGGPDTYLSAFNAVALPRGLSPDMRSAIEARSEQARDMAEEAGFAIARDNGSTDMRIKEQRQRQADDETIDRFASVAQQDARRRELEREEWAKTKSTVAGVTMTGGEWAQLAERMRNDEEFRRKLIETFEARGMSHAEAEARYERVADISEIAAKPPSQRSEQENETFKQAQADPTLKRDLQETQAFMDQRPGVNPSASAATPRDAAPVNSTAMPVERHVEMVSGPGF